MWAQELCRAEWLAEAEEGINLQDIVCSPTGQLVRQ
jgi:hypothetical protein